MATKIRWTDETWNPTTGCSKISEGCRNCYAEKLSLRFGWSTKPWTRKNATENVILHHGRLNKPYEIKTPSRIFVNSMSDLFHEAIPDDFIRDVFDVMSACPQHTFQVLTKRHERLSTWDYKLTSNIWLGVSVEDKANLKRIDALRQNKASIRFISFEPLLEEIDPDLTNIDWVIVGGEACPKFRFMSHHWARKIRDICVRQNIPFFFKQSSARKTEMGESLVEEDGQRTKWEQRPAQKKHISRGIRQQLLF